MSTFEKVKAIVADKLGVDEAKITESSSFVNDLGADSLDVVEFVMEVENKFEISIPDDAASQLLTVGDAVKYIDEHTGAKTVKMTPADGETATGGAKTVKMTPAGETSGKKAA